MMITSNKSSCRPLQPVFILFLLAAAAFVAIAQAPPPPPPPPAGPPIHHIRFDLRTETFNDLRIKILSALLTFSSKTPFIPPSVRGIYVLGPQRADLFDERPEWIYIHVAAGDTPQDKVTLAIAIDNLCLVGFSNGTDHWYKFSGENLKSHKGLPGATVLPITDNYRDLIKDGHKNLYKVPLGKKSAIHATKQLAVYDPVVTPEPQLQDGLVRFVVMMCEGMRLSEIRETFSANNNWEKETFITEAQAKSVVDWGSLSRLVIRWELTRILGVGPPKWGGGSADYIRAAKSVRKNSNIVDFQGGIVKLDCLLRPKLPVPTN